MRILEQIRLERMKPHMELLGYLQQISDDLRSPEGPALAQGITRMASPLIPNSSSACYYRGNELKSTHNVISCILLHIDTILSKLVPLETGVMNTTVMELNDWTAVVRIVANAHSSYTSHTGTLKFLIFNSTECKYALNVVASPVQGLSRRSH